tara:strand:+ start:189 stop:500 length:312 start_codon:yes stop_codon:yes gene_type:complete
MIDKINIKNLNSSFKDTKVQTGSSTEKSSTKITKVDGNKGGIESNYGKVSQFISKEKVKDMAKEPPIDKQTTSRIKAAIANGDYPIDLDKLTDALFDAYKEMK